MSARVSLFILLLGCLGCGVSHSSISGLWFFTYSEDPPESRDTSLNASSFLALRSDSTYTLDLGGFQYGTWSSLGGTITLDSKGQGSKACTYHLPGTNELSLYWSGSVHFTRNPLPAMGDSQDPFALGTNRWRLPARHKESDAEIRRRLLNHCQFWEAYFAWALKYRLDNVDVRSTPTPIKIWGNGFTLKPFAELPPAWKRYFYDLEDCRKANDMLKDIFENRTISWAHTDNKFEMFMGAFQQMEQYLR